MDLSPSDVVDEPDQSDDAGDSSRDPLPETSSSSSTLRDSLLSTSPEQRLDDVEAPYDPERGGVNRVYRGVRKMLDVDGLPAVADIGIGLIEWFESSNARSTSDDEQEDKQPETERGPDRPDDLDAVLDEVGSE